MDFSVKVLARWVRNLAQIFVMMRGSFLKKMVSGSCMINELCIINELFSTFSVYSLIIYHWKPKSKSLSEMGKSIGDHAYSMSYA